MLTINVIFFAVILVILIKQVIKQSKQHNDMCPTLKMTAGLMVIVCLLGFTAVFGLLITMTQNWIYYYLFPITSFILGFFTFVLFCISNSDCWVTLVKKLFHNCKGMETLASYSTNQINALPFQIQTSSKKKKSNGEFCESHSNTTLGSYATLLHLGNKEESVKLGSDNIALRVMIP